MKKRIFIIAIVLAALILWHGGKSILSPDKGEGIYTGMVEAKTISIKTQLSGELEKLYVSEGAAVNIGDMLYDVIDKDYRVEKEKALQSINISESKIKDLEEGYSMEEIDQVKAKISQNSSKISTLNEDKVKLQDRYNQILELKKAGAASDNEVTDSKIALEKVQYEIEGLKFAEAELNFKLKDMENGMDKNQIAIAQGELNIAKLNLENAENMIEKCHKASPSEGTVEDVFYEVGEFVPAGSSILNIVDYSDVWIETYVEEKNLPLVNVGGYVEINAYGTDQKISGKIFYISRTGEFTPKNIESRENKEEIVYKVKIIPEGEGMNLKPGMFVDVIISK